MRILIMSLAVMSFCFIGCSDQEGCTDQSAINYDPDADNDDGSCIYDDDGNGNGNGDDNGDEPEILTSINTPTTLEVRFENEEDKPDYIVDGRVNIDAPLTIEPGVHIEVRSGNRIQVNSEGQFNAVGTAENPIRIYGAEDVAGYWECIRFNGSNSQNNVMEHVHVSDAGGNSNYDGIIYTSSSSRLAMANCTVSNSERNGIVLSSETTVEAFEDNHIDACNNYPMYLNSIVQVNGINETTTFGDENTQNYIYISGRRNIEFDATFERTNVPFLLNGSTVTDGTVNIEPGAHIAMGSGASLRIGGEGTIRAIGTESERITIDGRESTKGYYDHFRIVSSSAQNEFQYVDMSYGGGDSRRAAIIYLSGGSSFTMGNSSINNSQRNGITGSSDATFIDDGNNTYDGNEDEDNTFL